MARPGGAPRHPIASFFFFLGALRTECLAAQVSASPPACAPHHLLWRWDSRPSSARERCAASITLLPVSGRGVGYRFELLMQSGNSSFCLPRGCYEARVAMLTTCSAQLEWTLGGKQGDGRVHTRVAFCSSDEARRDDAIWTRSLLPDALGRSTERFEAAHATVQVMLAGVILATVFVTLCVACVDDWLAGHDLTRGWTWDQARAALGGRAAEPSDGANVLLERSAAERVEAQPATSADGATSRTANPPAGIEMRATSNML